jgi:beta-phosphoglucomutase-like phosphatase (HAD superfamily)
VVEDAVVGVAAAKNAGMKCIAISTTHPRSALSAADIVVDNLEELAIADLII